MKEYEIYIERERESSHMHDVRLEIWVQMPVWLLYPSFLCFDWALKDHPMGLVLAVSAQAAETRHGATLQPKWSTDSVQKQFSTLNTSAKKK